MSQGRWTRYEKLNQLILKILKATKRHMTTNEIRTHLDMKYNLKINWHTLSNYLDEISKVGHIKKITIKRKKREVHNWTMRGAGSAKTGEA